MDGQTATLKNESTNDNPSFNFKGVSATAIVPDNIFSQREGRLRTECGTRSITRHKNERGVKHIIELPLTDVGSGTASALIPRSLLIEGGSVVRNDVHLTLKLAEFGGTSTYQPGNIARIICAKDGSRLKPIYVIKEENCELSGEVAFFGKTFMAIVCVATAKKLSDGTEIVEIDQITMSQNGQELAAQAILVASFLKNEEEEIGWQTEGFEEVIAAALEKLHCDGHFGVGTGCTLPHYCLTKDGRRRELEVETTSTKPTPRDRRMGAQKRNMNGEQSFFSPRDPRKKNCQACKNCPNVKNAHALDKDNPDPDCRNRLVCPPRT